MRRDRWAGIVHGGVAVGLLAGLLLAPAARADHPDFDLSSGIYRIPYVDGTSVTTWATTTPDGGPDGNKDRVDLVAGEGTEVVAAASGIIRAVVDFNGNSPDPGDGVDINGDPQDDSLEHSCQDTDDSDGNAIADSVVTGLCQEYNNYVWIEHPNGEWTKYTHFGTGTVTERGWAVGMAIDAGDVLGDEGDIGRARDRTCTGRSPSPTTPTTTRRSARSGGFIHGTTRPPDLRHPGDSRSTWWRTSTCANRVRPRRRRPPTLAAPTIVDEGAPLTLDGTGATTRRATSYVHCGAPTQPRDPRDAPNYTAIDGPRRGAHAHRLRPDRGARRLRHRDGDRQQRRAVGHRAGDASTRPAPPR